jgi:MFS transporter, YNFM family, putative membrane transport protein
MLGAAGMFATMYASQAILPELASDFDVTPSQAGLTISVVVLAVALAGWIWGPLSDRYGRKRSLVLASGLLVVPSVGAAVVPSFPALLVCRALQGACMPGLLTVGVPYVAEVYAPALGGRAMGYYTVALVAGGLLGRVGVGLVTAVADWRLAFGLLALLPLAGVVVMRRRLPEAPAPERSDGHGSALGSQLTNPAVLAPAVAAAALFFTFVGVFSYASFRLRQPPFGFDPAATSLVFGLWALGAVGPAAGRLADRFGWRRVTLASIAVAAFGVLGSLPSVPATAIVALALMTLGMFGGVTAAQLGLAAAGSADRGVASAIYFSFYYGAGALAGFLPGLAWEAEGWPGVVAVTTPALALGAVGLHWASRRATRTGRRPTRRFGAAGRPARRTAREARRPGDG